MDSVYRLIAHLFTSKSVYDSKYIHEAQTILEFVHSEHRNLKTNAMVTMQKLDEIDVTRFITVSGHKLRLKACMRKEKVVLHVYFFLSQLRR